MEVETIQNIILNSIYLGDMKMLSSLHKNGIITQTYVEISNIVSNAAIFGQTEILNWLDKNFVLNVDMIRNPKNETVYWTVEGGHNDIVEWLFLRFKLDESDLVTHDGFFAIDIAKGSIKEFLKHLTSGWKKIQYQMVSVDEPLYLLIAGIDTRNLTWIRSSILLLGKKGWICKDYASERIAVDSLFEGPELFGRPADLHFIKRIIGCKMLPINYLYKTSLILDRIKLMHSYESNFKTVQFLLDIVPERVWKKMRDKTGNNAVDLVRMCVMNSDHREWLLQHFKTMGMKSTIKGKDSQIRTVLVHQIRIF